MDSAVGSGAREELSRDPYAVYRRLRDAGVCVRLEAVNRYGVARWEDGVALDEHPQITAREEPSLMTRAMGRTMLRTDGAEHARLRAPAHAPLRFRGFAERWGEMLAREALDCSPLSAPAGTWTCCATSRPVRRPNAEAAAWPARR